MQNVTNFEKIFKDTTVIPVQDSSTLEKILSINLENLGQYPIQILKSNHRMVIDIQKSFSFKISYVVIYITSNKGIA